MVLKKLMERARNVPSYLAAVVCNGFRDRDKVVPWLGKALEERSSWLVWTKVEPRFDWLGGDPGFESVIARMKFP